MCDRDDNQQHVYVMPEKKLCQSFVCWSHANSSLYFSSYHDKPEHVGGWKNYTRDNRLAYALLSHGWKDSPNYHLSSWSWSSNGLRYHPIYHLSSWSWSSNGLRYHPIFHFSDCFWSSHGKREHTAHQLLSHGHQLLVQLLCERNSWRSEWCSQYSCENLAWLTKLVRDLSSLVPTHKSLGTRLGFV